MRVRIRRPAMAFAVLSALYWALISDLWRSLRGVNLTDGSLQPIYEDWLLNGLPAIIYAVVCLLFCHWLARRVARQIATLPKD